MKGGVVPSAEYEIVRENSVMAVINANGGLGVVAALKAMEMAIDKARSSTIGIVGIYNMGHVGRLGDYPPRAAKQGMIGIAMLNGVGRFVHPFGGIERRIPPNPISVSVPQKDGFTLLDMTTSVVAGGKFDVKQLPEGWLLNSRGESVIDFLLMRNDNTTSVPPLGGPQLRISVHGRCYRRWTISCWMQQSST